MLPAGIVQPTQDENVGGPSQATWRIGTWREEEEATKATARYVVTV